MVLHCKVTRVFIKREFLFLKIGQKNLDGNLDETQTKLKQNSDKNSVEIYR